jgi:hypothetical protein
MIVPVEKVEGKIDYIKLIQTNSGLTNYRI